MTQSRYEQLIANPQTAPYLTQAMLRDILLPNILGAENDAISYWAGKQLATQFPLDSFEDLCTFFEQINFGHLSLKKQKKDQYFFELTGPIVTARLTDFDEPDFQLEAGFIAQILEQQLRVVTEAKATIEHKKVVTIFVQTDTKAPIEDEAVTAIQITPTVATEQMPPVTPTEPTTAPVAPSTPEPEATESEPDTTPQYTSVADLPSRKEIHRKRK